jgi:hypothetical protein
VHDNSNGLLVFHAVRMLVQQCFVPHGICAGSEHQGGQHETGYAPVQSAVNYVTTMTVDGKNIDLVNYWYDKSALAGDELIFKLKKLPRGNMAFNLTSYYKDPQHKTVTTGVDCWQLVPDISRQDPETFERERCTHANAWKHHQSQGYWRVAQTFQKREKNNVQAFTKGMPLEVTFAPMWQSFGYCRDASSFGKFQVSTEATRFDGAHSAGKAKNSLCSVAAKDSLTFYYGQQNNMKFAFKMTSSQNQYTITCDPQTCKVYVDGPGSRAEVQNDTLIWKKTTPCLHVIFDADVKGKAYIRQNTKPHGNKTPKHS